MSDNPVNYGIQQSGGVSQVGNQAVGPGAYAVGGGLTASGPADLTALLTSLVEVLDRHRGHLPPPARALAADLRAELTRPQPTPPTRIRTLLQDLAEAAAPVTPVAVAVAEVLRAWQGG
ncbi:hypothetical protein [Micromonospora sp. SH-82]|uniref:hypothetical protein n=1 Tax=Micromonospora sp. SH-82 TaxID=3132938 RepID=UPI003EB74EA3